VTIFKLNKSGKAAMSNRRLIQIKIVLDMPPGVNKLYEPAIVKTPTGRVSARIHKSKICREWAAYARHNVTYQRSGQTIPYKFRVNLTIPQSYLDSDAPIKETLDACQHGGAIINDKYCMGGAWQVDETRPPGSMLVELSETADEIPEAMLRKLLQDRNQANLFD
jgi:hypothetical protein